jgi:L,D-transpeptidase YcbB
MKKLAILALVGISAVSCNGIAGWSGSNTDSTAHSGMASESKVWARDLSITKENAYSDLFLDSTVLDSFITREKLNEADAQSLRNFYNVRNFQYAWFSSSGPTEQVRGFWGLHAAEPEKEIKRDTAFMNLMDSLMQTDSLQITTPDTALVQTELQLTRELIEYAGKVDDDFIQPTNLYFLIPSKKMDAMALADSLLHKQKDSSLYAAHPSYTSLKTELNRYYEAAKSGGWQPITSAQNLAKGSKAPVVGLLKRRLSLIGDYPVGDTSAVLTDTLLTAIKDYQIRHGLAPTGRINDSLIQSLNVPAEERVQQILVNMNRMMWMQPLTDSNRIVVNIPSLMLYAYSDSGKVMEMPIVVGKEGSATVSFTDEINQVVFSPYWRLPESIIREEIMPKMKADPAYLKKRNMEITGQYNDSIPQIRQLPGKENALGQVKFLFPNSFDIYLHDTPDKSLFSRKDRAISHGCIRVAQPEALAQYLLRDQKEWTPEKIRQAMNGGKEQTVEVKKRMPVQINYFTAWMDEKGRLNFRPDVYGYDASVMKQMFKAMPV